MGELTAFELNEFIPKFNLKTYFETGTGMGVSLSHAMRYNFNRLYTIDIDNDFIQRAKRMYQNDSRLTCINDFSTKAIKDFVPTLSQEPTLFFLDAHFPGADFHKITYEESIRTYKEEAFPLELEINLLKSIRDLTNDVIIIDDFVLYDKMEKEYESVKEGHTWKYDWLQDELNIKTESSFIYEMFSETHDITKDLRHQGYLIITPKK